ncbi:MAG TPA: histidine phosphatase family protein [Miltoncostaeaceae bacterium]|nr:histidine phosphatase family protein [Miltoncostaeaceae bacterium]
MADGRTFALVRHGGTDYNSSRRLNGDPSVPVHLTAQGRTQVALLRDRLAGTPFDLGVRTRFPRTEQTIAILLDGRDTPVVVCADLDDVLLGEFEGASVEAYRRFRDERGQEARPRGGESRLDALARYARALERLLAANARAPLVVTHDIPIRFLANAIAGEDPLEGPMHAVANASLMTVGEDEMRRGVAAMRQRLAAV